MLRPKSRNTVASIRILSEELSPEAISRILNTEPTSSAAKGSIISPTSKIQRVRTDSIWSLDSQADPATRPEEHVKWLLDFVDGRREAWERLRSHCRVDMICSGAPGEGQYSFVLTAPTLRQLSSVVTEVWVTVYKPFED